MCSSSGLLLTCPLYVDLLILIVSVSQNLFAYFFLSAHPATKDILKIHEMTFQRGDRIFADHSAVGDYAERFNSKTLFIFVTTGKSVLLSVMFPGNSSQQIGRPCGIKYYAHDHLLQIRSMVFRMSVCADSLSSLALEVDRGGIEKHHL